MSSRRKATDQNSTLSLDAVLLARDIAEARARDELAERRKAIRDDMRQKIDNGEIFIPTDVQVTILEILRPENRPGQKVTYEKLLTLLKREFDPKTIRSHLRGLRKAGIVENRSGVGYYLVSDPPMLDT